MEIKWQLTIDIIENKNLMKWNYTRNSDHRESMSIVLEQRELILSMVSHEIYRRLGGSHTWITLIQIQDCMHVSV